MLTSECLALQDTSSFLAGERAALARAFRETLPSQQALGALSSGVKQVRRCASVQVSRGGMLSVPNNFNHEVVCNTCLQSRFLPQ